MSFDTLYWRGRALAAIVTADEKGVPVPEPVTAMIEACDEIDQLRANQRSGHLCFGDCQCENTSTGRD